MNKSVRHGKEGDEFLASSHIKTRRKSAGTSDKKWGGRLKVVPTSPKKSRGRTPWGK
jgi:hypothetical protein